MDEAAFMHRGFSQEEASLMESDRVDLLTSS